MQAKIGAYFVQQPPDWLLQPDCLAVIQQYMNMQPTTTTEVSINPNPTESHKTLL